MKMKQKKPTEGGIDPIIGTEVVESNKIHPESPCHIVFYFGGRNSRFVSSLSNLFIDTTPSSVYGPILGCHDDFQ